MKSWLSVARRGFKGSIDISLFKRRWFQIDLESYLFHQKEESNFSMSIKQMGKDSKG